MRRAVAVDLDQREAGGVVGLLEEVEAGDAGLAGAVAGVVDGGRLEGRDGLGLDVDVDDEDEHGLTSDWGRKGLSVPEIR